MLDKKTKQSRGFGFVSFSDPQGLQEALKLDGTVSFRIDWVIYRIAKDAISKFKLLVPNLRLRRIQEKFTTIPIRLS